MIATHDMILNFHATKAEQQIKNVVKVLLILIIMDHLKNKIGLLVKFWVLDSINFYQ